MTRSKLALLGVLLLSCGSGDESPTETTHPPASTTLPAVEGFVWGDPTASVEPQPGWLARDCEGDAPLICVEGPDGEVGLIEVGRFPGPSNAPEGDAEAELRALAADFVASISEDRAVGCGAGYEVEPLEPRIAVVAGRNGLRFGFLGLSGDGSHSERNIQHAVFDGADVVVITAASYAESGCPGRDDLDWFQPDALERFDRGLSALVAGLPLP